MAGFALVTFCVLFIRGIASMGLPVNGQQNIRPTTIYSCEDFESIYECSFTLRTIDEDNNKVFDMELEMVDEFNEDWSVSVILDKWNNGRWDENFYNVDRYPVHDFIDDYCLEIWHKAIKFVSPPLSEECRADPGHYTLKDFEVSKTEFKLPAYIDGKYRGTVYVQDANGIPAELPYPARAMCPTTVIIEGRVWNVRMAVLSMSRMPGALNACS